MRELLFALLSVPVFWVLYGVSRGLARRRGPPADRRAVIGTSIVVFVLVLFLCLRGGLR